MNCKRDVPAIDAFIIKLIAVLERFIYDRGLKNDFKFLLSKGINIEWDEATNCYLVIIKPVVWPEGNVIITTIYTVGDIYTVEDLEFDTPDIPEIYRIKFKGKFNIFMNLDKFPFTITEYIRS